MSRPGAVARPIRPGPRIRSLSVEPYRLPLCRPWQSASATFLERRGWLVIAQSEGVRGYGDCAPLPQAGTETAERSAAALSIWVTELQGLEIDGAMSRLGQGSSATPAVAMALECALLDLQSRIAGVSLRRWIGGQTGGGVADAISVNAMLGAVGKLTDGAIAGAIDRGFGVLKLKVGLAGPEPELAALARIAADLPPGVRLRLDANGAWDSKTAGRVVARLNDLPVESLEEPLAVPNADALACLQALAVFPLALDESLGPLVSRLGSEGLPVRRAVLKPTVIGGLRATLGLARRLQAAGVETVLTGLVESAAGLWPVAQLAAAAGGPLPHGLDTARWLAEDLGTAPAPAAGALRLPDEPGSGFHPHSRENDDHG